MLLSAPVASQSSCHALAQTLSSHSALPPITGQQRHQRSQDLGGPTAQVAVGDAQRGVLRLQRAVLLQQQHLQRLGCILKETKKGEVWFSKHWDSHSGTKKGFQREKKNLKSHPKCSTGLWRQWGNSLGTDLQESLQALMWAMEEIHCLIFIVNHSSILHYFEMCNGTFS